MTERKAARYQWTCPYCHTPHRRRSRESEEQFAERCGVHRRQQQRCEAVALARRLEAEGMARLESPDRVVFVLGYDVLKEAGLVQRHRTQLVSLGETLVFHVFDVTQSAT